MKRVELEKKVISENEKLAQANREKYAKEGTFVLNLVSSPGSGKTRLIEETAERLKDELRILVLTGDIMTENDARRVARHGVEAVQITTGGACHLDARMVDEKLAPYKDKRNFGLKFLGYLRVPRDGLYRFHMASPTQAR